MLSRSDNTKNNAGVQLLLHSRIGMLLRIQFVEKTLRKVARIVADAFQVVEVFRRDLLENLSHPRHGKARQTIANTARIDAIEKISHKLASLRLTNTRPGLFEIQRDMPHVYIVSHTTLC